MDDWIKMDLRHDYNLVRLTLLTFLFIFETDFRVFFLFLFFLPTFPTLHECMHMLSAFYRTCHKRLISIQDRTRLLFHFSWFSYRPFLLWSFYTIFFFLFSFHAYRHRHYLACHNFYFYFTLFYSFILFYFILFYFFLFSN